MQLCPNMTLYCLLPYHSYEQRRLELMTVGQNICSLLCYRFVQPGLETCTLENSLTVESLQRQGFPRTKSLCPCQAVKTTPAEWQTITRNIDNLQSSLALAPQQCPTLRRPWRRRRPWQSRQSWILTSHRCVSQFTLLPLSETEG